MDLSAISCVRRADEVRPIQAGYSTDKKFLLKKGGESTLLKVFEAKDLAERQEEFQLLGKMAELDVLASRPLEIGVHENLGFMHLSYFEGADAGAALPGFSPREQYQIGIQAAEELRKIHLLKAPSTIASWGERKLAKHKRYLDQYLAGDVRFNRDERVIQFIENHLSQLEARPNFFQHDDYHPRNLIVREGSLVGVIDFQRHDWGDPLHDFVKIGQFTVEVSVPFALGQIQGYFATRSPGEDFWLLYSLYQAISFFGAIVWAKNVCPAELPEMVARINRITKDHGYFEHFIPKWYENAVSF